MRIVAATDGSEPANRAIEFAARLAKKFNGSLKIVHIVAENDLPSSQLSDYTIGEHASEADVLEAFSHDMLRLARERAVAAGAPDIDTASLLEIEAGGTAETIIDAATRNNADLIVTGKRGLGRLSGLLVGSVSQKVVSTAPCTVMVVP
jgi:nucleotide-binding universal stress UspA family protein